MAGAAQVPIVSTESLDANGARQRRHRAAGDAAARAGALLAETARATRELSRLAAITIGTQVTIFAAVLGPGIRVMHLDDAAFPAGLASAHRVLVGR